MELQYRSYVDIISSSFHDILLTVKVNNKTFLLTALYASPDYAVRKNIWINITNFSNSLNLPWLIMGNFNEIARLREKFGGRPSNRTKINGFLDFLNKAKLIDLGFVGPKLT